MEWNEGIETNETKRMHRTAQQRRAKQSRGEESEAKARGEAEQSRIEANEA